MSLRTLASRFNCCISTNKVLHHVFCKNRYMQLLPCNVIEIYQTSNVASECYKDNMPHVSAMSREVVQILDPQPGKIFIDMTFGAGGHTAALLDKCSDIKVFALDCDINTMQYCTRLQALYGNKAIVGLHGRFTDLLKKLEENRISTHCLADGVLLDVGVSSMQLNNRKRGFSLSQKCLLDMRMNRVSDTITAADVVNKLDEKDIQKILKRYGEEKKAKAIARAIVEYRQMLGPIENTRDLQDIIRTVYDGETRQDKLGRQQHPATLTFQALRIFVNDELNQLYNGLKIAHRLLKPFGHCAVITFHSLEHNIVHQSFRAAELRQKETYITEDLTLNPCSWITDGSVLKPSNQEIADNPRVRSAELRQARKLN